MCEYEKYYHNMFHIIVSLFPKILLLINNVMNCGEIYKVLVMSNVDHSNFVHWSARSFNIF